MSDYIHHVPGRLRVRARSLRSHHCDTAALCEVLESLPGLKERSLNPKIGSLLVYYDPTQLSAEDILYHMVKAGCLPSGLTAAAEKRSSGPVSTVSTMVGSALFGTLFKKGLETSITSLARGLR